MNHHKNDEVKANSVHRIKIIKGHLNKIERMLENDQYCVDIVHQSRAVQRALKKLDMLIIENHLQTCVVDQVRNGEDEKTTDELLKLFAYK